MGKQTVDLQKIKLLLLDVDGVMTDGAFYIHSDGTESKRFCVFDGHRIKMWLRAGLQCAIISGRESKATTIRAEQLGIQHVLQGCREKVTAFEQTLEKLNLTPDEVVFVGDDLLDLPLLRRVGFAVAVANAATEVKTLADYITTNTGGNGAVGEVIEYLLKATGRWEELIRRYMV